MANSPHRLTIRRPDDWHVHFRDRAMLAAVVPFTARCFARAIAMPNLVPPVTTVDEAFAYRERILRAVPEGVTFEPLTTCYLTDHTSPAEIERGWWEGAFSAAKLYPAHATTNAEHGVTSIRNIYSVLEVMQKLHMPLLVHGEVTAADVDVFDREAVFIERVLQPLHADLPGLKVVFEHITTAEAVDYVRSASVPLAATITAHHLVINRNAIFDGGIRPHMYCLPVAKREKHRLALRRAAASGDSRFFLGTDSAPHPVHLKEAACGCAGLFTAPAALELYATVFDEEGALDKLEGFASRNGPSFYGLPINDETVTLERRPWTVPALVRAGTETVMPFRGGEDVAWQVVPAG